MTIHKIKRSLAGVFAVGVAFAALSATAVWAENATVTEAQQTLEVFKKADPGLAAVLAKSAGYAVFPKITKGAVGVGGAAGKGVLFEGKGKASGNVDMSQVTIGLALGGQTYSELIIFEDATPLTDFKKNNFNFAAQMTAVAASAGASANAKFEKGVLVYTVAKGGLMYEASIGGQKFTFKPFPGEKVGMR